MINKASRAEIREKKHRRIRHHLNGTATTPRLAVFRSNKHMYAQIIDDTVGKTLVSASTLQKDVKAELENTDRYSLLCRRQRFRYLLQLLSFRLQFQGMLQLLHHQYFQVQLLHLSEE